MLRFSVNRFWTLILALCLTFALLSMGAKSLRADEFNPSPSEIADPNGGGATSTGDPDVPDGPGKSSYKTRNGVQRQVGIRNAGVRSVGDGMASDSALVWKLRVVLLALRKYYLSF